MKPSEQMSDSFRTAAFLSLSGGLQDAYTYLCRGQVFANAQTGNIVLLAQQLVEGNFHLAMNYLIPLGSFALGVAVAEWIRQGFRESGQLHWRQRVLIMEIILLFAVGFMPESMDRAANALVSFSCAMQVQAFRKVHGYAYASTMCIGNLRSGTESLCTAIRTQKQAEFFKAMHYFGIIFLFALGAGLGAYVVKRHGLRAIWVSCILLAIGFMLMFFQKGKRTGKV